MTSSIQQHPVQPALPTTREPTKHQPTMSWTNASTFQPKLHDQVVGQINTPRFHQKIIQIAGCVVKKILVFLPGKLERHYVTIASHDSNEALFSPLNLIQGIGEAMSGCASVMLCFQRHFPQGLVDDVSFHSKWQNVITYPTCTCSWPLISILLQAIAAVATFPETIMARCIASKRECSHFALHRSSLTQIWHSQSTFTYVQSKFRCHDWHVILRFLLKIVGWHHQQSRPTGSSHVSLNFRRWNWSSGRSWPQHTCWTCRWNRFC